MINLCVEEASHVVSGYSRSISGDVCFHGPMWYLSDKENLFHLLDKLMLSKQLKQVKVHIGSDDCYYSLQLHVNSPIGEQILHNQNYSVLRFYDFSITPLGNVVVDDLSITMHYVSHGVLHGMLEGNVYASGSSQIILIQPPRLMLEYKHPVMHTLKSVFSNWHIHLDKDIQHSTIYSDGAVCRTHIFSRLTATLV